MRDGVFELRRYTLLPGRRDELIELFDREFVESQDALGAHIVAQFRDLDDPDQFVWIRSFADLPARLAALTAFYTGPVWKQHAAAANATMVAVDNVLLLRPLLAPNVEPGSRDRPKQAELTALLFALDRPATTDDEAWLSGVLADAGVAPLALFATLDESNDFPALPVRAVQRLVALVESRPATMWPGDPEVLRLVPTARSQELRPWA